MVDGEAAILRSAPLVLRALETPDAEAVLALLNLAHVADALDLRPPLLPEHLAQARLPAWSVEREPIMVRARLFTVGAAPVGEARGACVGVVVYYPLDEAGLERQEVDLALAPGSVASPRVLRRLLAEIVERVFVEDRTRLLRARITLGRGAKAFATLLTELGALPEGAVPGGPPGSKRLLFWLTPERYRDAKVGR